MNTSRFFNPLRFVGRLLNLIAWVSPRLAGRLGLTLFCWPRRKNLKRVEAAFLATGELQYEDLDGRRYAVWHWGFRGPVVLLAHGWESHSGRWRKIAPHLAQAGYHVIAVDAPAHGRSSGWQFTMLEYAAIIRHLLHKHSPVAAVVAHSVGGAAAIWAMGTSGRGSRPAKAVILGAFSHLSNTMRGPIHATGLSERTQSGFKKYFLQRFGLKTEEVDVAAKAALLHDVEGLLVHDAGDRVTSVKESERLHAYWPGAHFWRTQHYGHGLTAPQVTDVVTEFIASGNLTGIEPEAPVLVA